MNSVPTKCVVCRKTIEPDAKKCTECDSYQDWTRHILRYASVAGAILGIIPVITITVSLYEIAFGKKSSDVRAALVRCGQKQLDIGITNVGEVPAIVSKVVFRSPDTPPLPDTFNIRRMGDEKPPSSSTFLVDPTRSAKIVSYKPFIDEQEVRFPQFPSGAATCKYHITIESLQFNQATKSQELTCDCPRS